MAGIKIDRTAPVTTATAPAGSSVTISARHPHGDDDKEGKAELRTYNVLDQAGNSLVLVLKVKKEGHEVKVMVEAKFEGKKNQTTIKSGETKRSSLVWCCCGWPQPTGS